MKIGIFHGYELTGSGSNQVTQYLAQALARAGHEVHIFCREPDPGSLDFLDKAIQWNDRGRAEILFEKKGLKPGASILHQLPLPPVNAVYITDTQRPGKVKAFSDLTDRELQDYHRFVVHSLQSVLKVHPVDILHANHLVYQPVAAAEVCEAFGIPFIIYPHGSAIEYTIRHDGRYRELARDPILQSNGLIIGNTEVQDRLTNLYPNHRREILSKTQIVGLGVDTSLFLPVEKRDRRQSIEKVYRHAPFTGKSPHLSLDLYARLDNGDVDSVSEYGNAYPLKEPDRNLADKLQQIPWQSNILVFVGATIVGKGLQAVITALPFILKRHPDTHLVIIGSGVSREIFEGLVYAIATKNEVLLDTLIAKGFDLDPIELSGPWRDVKAFLSNHGRKTELFAHGSDLMNHVHFLGRLDHHLLRHVFPCADVGFFPSIVPEAYASVLYESLSNGVFPMASYFSGLACGLDELVPFLGPELVDMMKIPVDDDARIPGLIENLSRLLAANVPERTRPDLRRIAVENFDWQIRARQMASAYTKCIRDPHFS